MKKLMMVAVLTTTFATQAQENTNNFFNHVTLEAGYGFNQALMPDNVDRTDVSGLKTMQLGANYQIDELWGVRGTYSNTQFQDKNNDDLGINYNRITAEATFGVLKAIYGPEDKEVSRFDIVAHSGFGLNFGKSKANDSKDTMGNWQIGLKPEYKISNNVGIFVDGTYIMNFKQNIGYNGLSIAGEKETTGSYVTALIGLSIKLNK